MRQQSSLLEIATSGKGFVDITAALSAFVRGTSLQQGLLTVLVRHTSASLVVQENADPDVRRDLETFFSRLVPEDGRSYTHCAEGSDDMPAHVRAALTQTHLGIPVFEGRLRLGTWQGVYLYEHRSRPQQRTLALHIIGE